jgi:hypothetical protein
MKTMKMTRDHSSSKTMEKMSRGFQRNQSAYIVDEENQVVKFPLSSEESYRRYYYSHGCELDEILLHGKSNVDLTFLNSGNAPLLDSHKSYAGLSAVIGVIRRAWLGADKRVYVECAVSKNGNGTQLFNDIRDGIIKNVSVGYEVMSYEVDEEAETYKATKWRPFEASFVSIPADTTVGIGRSNDKRSSVVSDVILPGDDQDEKRAEAMKTNIDEILKLAATKNHTNTARNFIEGQLKQGETPSLALFKSVLLSELPNDEPLVNTEIGLTQKERQSFSVLRLMHSIAQPNDPSVVEAAEFEREACAAAVERMEEKPRHSNIVIPSDLMGSWGNFGGKRGRMDARALVSAGLSGGNPNVLTIDHLAESFIDNLRNVSAVYQAGATSLTGLSSDVEIPGGDQNIAAAWLAAENADAAGSKPTFRKVTMQPKDVAVFTDVSRRMMQQSTIDMENYVRAQIVEAVRLAIDSAAIYGTGSNGQPTGVVNTTGIGSVTFGAAKPTRDEIVDLRTAVASNNTPRDGLTYMSNADMVGHLQKTRTDPGSADLSS